MKKRTLQSMMITVALVLILLIPICISIGADEEEKPSFKKEDKEVCNQKNEYGKQMEGKEVCTPKHEYRKHMEGKQDKKIMSERRVKPGDRESMHKDRLFESLDLSEDQKKDLDELFKTHRESVRNTMKELRDKKASNEEFGETFKNLRADFENKMSEILTPEQFEKYKEAKEQYREQFKRKPQPKPLQSLLHPPFHLEQDRSVGPLKPPPRPTTENVQKRRLYTDPTGSFGIQGADGKNRGLDRGRKSSVSNRPLGGTQAFDQL